MADDDKVRLSLTQLVGAAVAAVAAAVAASFLGVYGTIVGAAVVSVVSTAGTVLYEQSVHRSKNRFTNRRGGTAGPGGTRRVREVWDRARARLRRRRWWKPVGVVSLAVFAVALGTVTVIETGIGKPLAAALTGQQSSGGRSIRAAVTGGTARPAAPAGPARESHENEAEDAGQQRPATSSAPSTQQSPPSVGNPGQEQQQQPDAGTGGHDTSPTPTEPAPPTPLAPVPTPDDGDEPQRVQPTPQPAETR